MHISLENAGRRFNREWIFRHVDLSFQPGDRWVILGNNGSGKSTLLQSIAGFLRPSEGKVVYQNNGSDIDQEEVYQHIALASPYLEIFEDYNLVEAIGFHRKFKPLLVKDSPKQIAERIGLGAHTKKQVANFSSGMRQKLRLALAILSDTEVLLLDEPTSNLDADAISWYQQMVAEYGNDRLIIVCSNHQTQEYGFCTQEINMTDLKVNLGV